MNHAEPISQQRAPSRWISIGVPAALIGMAAVMAAWVAFSLHPMDKALYSDMGEYAGITREIIAGKFKLDHFFKPIGYALWMALWLTVADGAWWLLKLTHVALVVASVFLGWRVARLVLPRPWDIVALVLLSFQIQWWALAGFALAETLYTFLVTALLWSTTRWILFRRGLDAAMAGLFFACGFFVKGSAIFFPLLLLGWIAVRAVRRPAAAPLPAWHLVLAGFAALGIALAHGAFALENYGQFKLGADSGGLNFVEGKCRHKENWDSRGYAWMSPLFVQLGETDIKRWDEPFTNQPFFWKEGLKCIKDNPAVLITSVRYVYYLFGGNSLWPVQAWRAKPAETLYEQGFLFVVTPLAFIGLIVALRRWDRPEVAAALLMLSLFLMVYVFKSELRYRVPFDAATIVLATVGVRAIVNRTTALVRRKAPRSPVDAETLPQT